MYCRAETLKQCKFCFSFQKYIIFTRNELSFYRQKSKTHTYYIYRIYVRDVAEKKNT